VPADRLPSRIGIALWASAAQRPCQPFRMVDELRRGTALGTERLAGGMAGIGLETRKAAVLDHCDRAAPRNAERAIGMSSLRAGVVRHSIFTPYFLISPRRPQPGARTVPAGAARRSRRRRGPSGQKGGPRA